MIRQVKKKDLIELARLDTTIFGDTTFRQALIAIKDIYKNRVKGACFVVEENKTLIGTILVAKRVSFTPNSAYLAVFFIDTNWRHTGLGKKLMLECLKACKKAGVKNLSLNVKIENKHAIKFYEKSGFKLSRLMYIKKL